MNSHLTHQEQLAYLDGELSKSEKRKAELHLHSCWTCRISMERLERDIAIILDAQNEIVAPAIPSPPRSWPAFDSLLARNPPTALSSLRRFLEYINPLSGPAWMLITSSLLVALVIFTYSMSRSKLVSAKELLRQVDIADAQRVSIANDQVVREHVHIRKSIRGRSRSQLEELDAWKSRKATYWNAPSGESIAADLEAQYRAHDVPVDLPLSAASVDSWSKATGGNPTVSQVGGDFDLSFTGNGDSDSIERVSLLIQPQTWQVKQMTLQFSDAAFEVTEEDFSHLPISAVPTELLAHLDLQVPAPVQTLVKHVVRPIPAAAASSIRLQSVDLDAAELDVLTTLHSLNADLGEPVTITRSSREIEVGVWQLPADRQHELIAALQDKPGVQVQSEAPVVQPYAGGPDAPPMALPDSPRVTVTDSADEDQRLFKFFGSAQAEEAFTRQALATSTAILSHLYALRNLQNQFSPQQEKALTSDRQVQLEALVADHVVAATTGADALKAELAPLDSAFNISQASLPASTEITNWRSGSLDALEAAKVVDHFLRSLLTTSQTPVPPDTALLQIQQNLGRLAAALGKLSAAAN